MIELESNRSFSILIVDDEPNNIQLLGNILKKENFDVEFALTGKESLEWLTTKHFDLILLDVVMSGMDGFEVCQKIREKRQLKDMPVIFLSALNQVDHKIKGFEVGGNDYITKPFQAEEVIARIKNHLALKEAHDSLNLAIEEREKSNLLLNAILSSIPDTLITVDQDLNILNINRKSNPICNLEDHSMDALQKIIQTANDPCRQIIQKTLRTKKPIKNQRTTRADSNGVKKTLELSTTPIMDQHSVFTGVLLVVRDITRLIELETKLQERRSFRNIIGQNSSMQKIYSLLEQIADVNTSVLINGESGTGKELIADALHYGSKRAGGPFIRVNCAALSESLLESELFGHVKGAFTGATENRMGRFQAAHNGTIFLDEIGDISAQVQVKLLRVLEQKEFERIGESKTIKVNVRIVAATNADLKEKIASRQFREDLYYRLKGIEIELPPLRNRKDDIPLLCDYFLSHFNDTFNKQIREISESVLNLFIKYEWPGNIRELRHAIEHACILCNGDKVTCDHLPKEILKLHQEDTKSPVRYAPKISQELLKQTLEINRWNKVKTAKALGIGRNTLYRYLAKFDLDDD